MIYIAYTLLSTLLYYFSVVNFLPQKLLVKQKICFLVINIFIHIILAPRMSQFATIATVFCTILFLFKATDKNWFAVACGLFGYFFNVVLNNCVLFFYMKYIDPNLFTRQYPFRFVILYLVLMYPLTKFLGWFLHHKLKIGSHALVQKLGVPLFLNLLLCLCLTTFNIIVGERVGYSNDTIFFNMCIFLAYFAVTTVLLFLVYRTTKNLEQDKHLAEQNRVLGKYAQTLESAYAATRKIKHDYDNVLFSIGEYIEKEDLISLQTYYQKEVIPYSSQKPRNPFFPELSNLQIPELKSLITVKLFEAQEKGLQVHLEIQEKIAIFPLPVLHLVRIMGIFLDNAIEAAVETEEKELKIAIISMNTGAVIMVENSTLPLSLSIKEMRKDGYTSKGKNHGTGLGNVAELVQKHPKITWHTKYKEGVFTQILEIGGG